MNQLSPALLKRNRGFALVYLCAILVIVFSIACGSKGTPTTPTNSTQDATPEPTTKEPDGPPIFEDVTAASGVAFTYRNGEEANRYTILESLGGGVAFFDYDNDGKLDLFVTGGGSFDAASPPNIRGLASRLYRNLGGLRFADVTAQVGLDSPIFYSHGAHAADYDRDGFPDLLVTGWNRVVLYHNERDDKGGRKFVDVTTKSELTDTRWSSSAAWGDLDGDGFPDLYICYYVDWSFANDPACRGSGRDIVRDVCQPQKFKPLQHRLYKNRGNGTFHDITSEAPLRPDGKGLGVIIADVTSDGKPDIYVGNDAGDNFLYVNRGGMRFEEKGFSIGVAVDEHGQYNGSMGVDVGDYDGTGRPSIWVTNFQGEYHAMYRNLGVNGFKYSTQAAGLGRIGQKYVGFGTGFLDFDHDGWEDLVIANGHVLRSPVGSAPKQRPLLLHNEEHDGRRQFREPPGSGGPYFRTELLGRGVAIGDLDDDGWPDFVVSHQNTPVAILRNVASTTMGKGNHWLGVKLVGKGERDLVGCTVTLEVNGRKLTQFVKGGGSYLSTSDTRIRFGLGSTNKVGRLTVKWSGGIEQHFDGLTPDRYLRIIEGEPVAK